MSVTQLNSNSVELFNENYDKSPYVHKIFVPKLPLVAHHFTLSNNVKQQQLELLSVRSNSDRSPKKLSPIRSNISTAKIISSNTTNNSINLYPPNILHPLNLNKQLEEGNKSTRRATLPKIKRKSLSPSKLFQETATFSVKKTLSPPNIKSIMFKEKRNSKVHDYSLNIELDNNYGEEKKVIFLKAADPGICVRFRKPEEERKEKIIKNIYSSIERDEKSPRNPFKERNDLKRRTSFVEHNEDLTPVEKQKRNTKSPKKPTISVPEAHNGRGFVVDRTGDSVFDDFFRKEKSLVLLGIFKSNLKEKQITFQQEQQFASQFSLTPPNNLPMNKSLLSPKSNNNKSPKKMDFGPKSPLTTNKMNFSLSPKRSPNV